jgi:hypothetical protein
MKKLTVLLLFVFCLNFAGCSKDGEVATFMTEWDSVTNEMAKSLEAGSIDEARKTFDAKKDSLKTKWDGVKGARGFQVSEASKKSMEDGAKKNMETLSNAIMKGSMKMAGDKAASDKMQALMKEYGAIFTM